MLLLVCLFTSGYSYWQLIFGVNFWPLPHLPPLHCDGIFLFAYHKIQFALALYSFAVAEPTFFILINVLYYRRCCCCFLFFIFVLMLL